MPVKKLKDISSEELLNSLNDEKLEVQSTPVYDFIERFDLKEGNFLVPSRILYALFLQYYPKTLILEHFNIEASILLPYDRHQSRYRLNKQSKLIHYEAAKLIELEREKYNSVQPNSPALRKHLNTWIEKHNITKGNLGIPWFVLYDVYRNYCIDIGFKTPKSAKTFNNYIKFHFEYHNNDYGPVYFINIDEKLLPQQRMYDKLKEKYQKKSF